MEDDYLPVPSKKRMKRIAAKKQRKEAKRKKIEDLCNLPGTDTITESEATETTTFIDEGLRFVKSYPFIFEVFAKARWIGRNAVEVMNQEYRGHSLDYYKEEVRRGLVQVDNHMIGFDHVFTAKDKLHHKIHRHEPPVTAEDVKIVHQDHVVVVIDKPGSMPVHPTGRYRHNTVMFWLAKERGIRNLYPVHRLDKLTSGLLVFARNSQKAEQIAQEIRSTRVQKTYLARVEGRFPDPSDSEEETTSKAAGMREVAWEGDLLIVNAPILVTTDIGLRELNRVDFDDARAKPCETHFKRLFYDGTHSVVQCAPKTGRTHQIRVHLIYLGHPIANDPLYNPRFRDLHAEPWEIEMADGEDDIDEDNVRPSEAPSSTPASAPEAPTTTTEIATTASIPTESDASSAPTEPSKSGKLDLGNFDQKLFEQYVPGNPHIDIKEADPVPLCHLCAVQWRRPNKYQLRLWLHALSYVGENFSYETDTPEWAVESYITDPEHEGEVVFVTGNEPTHPGPIFDTTTSSSAPS